MKLPPDESGIILCTAPANERQHYTVKPSLVGWTHTQNDPWWMSEACDDNESILIDLIKPEPLLTHWEWNKMANIP